MKGTVMSIKDLCLDILTKRPDRESDCIKRFFDKITSSMESFVEAFVFLNEYERDSKEFRYFVHLHIKFIEEHSDYMRMYHEALTDGTPLQIMFSNQ